jgi:hypothetical protein
MLVVGIAAACSSGGSDNAATTTSTSTTSTSSSTTSTVTSTTAAPTVPGQPATASCPAVPPRAQPDPHRPRYTLHVDVRPSDSIATGDLSVTFTPDVATDRLVFRLWPNGPVLAGAGAHLDAGPVAIDGGSPQQAQQPNATTLVVPLGHSIEAGRTISASMPWTLRLPGAVEDRVARIGDTVRMGSFFPLLAWEPGVGWAMEPPTTAHAETATSPTADFDLTVAAPAGLQVFATGDERAPGLWHASAVRDVSVVVGRFRVVNGLSAGVPITVAVENGLPDDPNVFLRVAVDAIDDLSRRLGPYPWSHYTIAVTPALHGGIEYPMLVSAGSGSYGRSTPHEVGHQWFYGLVGNNQARDPWLDEGLASWAEARVLGNLSSFVNRDIPADARGHTGSPMTFWDGRASYYRGVYVQGTQALAALGNPDAVDCALRIYVARNAFGIARPDDLVNALETVFPNARATLARFGAV